MSARRFSAQQQAISMTAATPITLAQLVAAANHAFKLLELAVGFQSTDNTDTPVLIELVRQTTPGTMTSLTLVKDDDSGGDTLDTTAQHTATAEPTTTDVLRSWRHHPQAGSFVLKESDLDGIVCGAGDRLAIRATSAQNQTADVYMVGEE